ncbi:Hypothetical predicted protein [Mytilus galloprovincialis]|uniref:Uncharacterized protein n=1 Tax=Mytilus galloprovincialis TaxID=29158 RepID=A0A8B6GLK3_MYTGA|nr:Hypothetical predicted protein [Mytilus galloprovincialis]
MKKDRYVCIDLIDAISAQKYKLSRIIIEGGADINWNVNGVTPIMEACLLPNNNELKYQLILLLLSYGSNLGLRDNLGRTALHYAYMGSCQKKVIELLQEQRRRKA